MIDYESKTQIEFRNILTKYHSELFTNPNYSKLLEFIKLNCKNIVTAYFLEHIIDQDYNGYTLLLNDNIVCIIEEDINNGLSEFSYTQKDTGEYLKKMKKNQRIKFNVAVDLAKNDINQHM